MFSYDLGHFAETGTAIKQLFVSALRYYLPMRQFHNDVAVPHSAEPVGDKKNSSVTTKPSNRIHYRLFSRVVKGASGFIEHQYAGLFV